MLGKFILTEKQEKDNRIQQQLIDLVQMIDSNWRRIEQQIEAIAKNLHCKLQQDKVTK